MNIELLETEKIAIRTFGAGGAAVGKFGDGKVDRR